MGVQPITRLAAQYLRDCHQSGTIVTRKMLAEATHTREVNAGKLFQNANRFARREFGVFFQYQNGTGWVPVDIAKVAATSTTIRQRAIKSATEKWRDDLAIVNPTTLDESSRAVYYGSVAKLQFQTAVNTSETQQSIEQAEAAKRRGSISIEDYASRTLSLLRGSGFG